MGRVESAVPCLDSRSVVTRQVCPFAQRAWIALEEKGADYEYVAIEPYQEDASKPGGSCSHA